MTLASLIATGGTAAKAAAQSVTGPAKKLPSTPASQASGPPGAQANTPSPADQAFESFVDRYFDGFFQFDPVQATCAGIHKYDGELPAYSSSDVQAEIVRDKRALWAIHKISSESLSPDNQFDAQLLESLIRGRHLDLTDISRWSKDPNFYAGIASEALFPLVERDFAPLDDRLQSLIARAERIPEVLKSARANVANPPGISTQVAIERTQAQINFLQDFLPQVVAGTTSAALKTQFNTANQQVLTAYSQFLGYLQSDLSARSQGEFAIGAENFRKMLLYDEMVDAPVGDLLRMGHHELRRTQSLFRQTAQILDSTKPPLEILRSLSQENFNGKQALKDAQSTLDTLRQFVVTHEIVTIPPAPIPEAKKKPPFVRGSQFASLDTPGALEQHSIQSFFYLSFPASGLKQAPQQSQQLQFPQQQSQSQQPPQSLESFDPYAVRLAAIDQVYPGRYAQFLYLKDAASKARKLEPSLSTVRSNSEGWGQYCEEMMLEQGYGEGDPKLLLTQLQASLVQLCRLIVSIRMHTEGMTIAGAAGFFQNEAYLDPANAQREAVHSALDPGCLAGALGKLAIMKLRGDDQQKLGEKFSLRDFHDRFLSFGMAPVKMIREQMLEDNSPVL